MFQFWRLKSSKLFFGIPMTVLSNCEQNSLPSFNKEKEYSNFIESYNTKKLETKEDFDDYSAYRKNPDQKWFL